MTNAALHELLVQRVADEYRGKGYQVTVEPTPDALPPIVGDYRPDLVAVSPQESVVVEVKVKGDRSPSERFSELARRIGEEPGWRFALVIGDPTEAGQLPVEAASMTLDDVERSENAAGQIAAQSPTGAFLILWAAVEALLRMVAKRGQLPLERVPTSILIRDLYSAGELSAEDFEAAIDLQQVRNSVAHGFVTGDVVAATGRLRQLLKNLKGELQDADKD
jgi:hypothetical protein